MTELTIKDIEARLQGIKDPQDPLFRKLKNDKRKGVLQLLSKWEHRYKKDLEEQIKFKEMSRFEEKIRKQGFSLIAGIDEVGRGPLAGPVIAAAVILPETFYLPGIDDSKKLSEQKREVFYKQISEQAIAVQVGIITAKEIDQINIYQASKKAMLSAVAQLGIHPDYLLIDAVKLETPYPFEAIIKGDSKSISIAAASIIAKVTRDRLMKNLAEEYPQYGFERNMGYGTKEHLTAIATYGITPYHRKSFAPVKEWEAEHEEGRQ
ncbi:ribonuclease HII [Bacillaceae bacterium Marseille-Q3522]|nr:ribonuclease HII [Bacillaceae bacterium Marseille-Q3522]